jgi:Uma2 family endonuclease
MVANIRDLQRTTKITVADYHEMIDKGILGTNDRVELIDGQLVSKMPQNSPHIITITLLHMMLIKMIGQAWHVRSQGPITLEESEPEPDLAIVRGEIESYSPHHPHASDISIAIEVADSSLAFDRTDKKSTYAKEGIREYWIVNIPNKQIEVFSDPVLGEYRQTTIHRVGDSCPVVLDGVVAGWIDVTSLIRC